MGEIKEIVPGIFHWTTHHPRIKQEVSSYYVPPAATLIDPRLPEGGLDAIAELGAPERIVLTNRHHYRDSDAIRERFGCPVLCHEAGLHEFVGGPDVEGFAFGDEVAPGIRALEMAAICPEDTALHIAVGGGALGFADGLVRDTGEVGYVPDFLMGDDPEGVKRATRAALKKLLGEDFDTLLFAHGPPLVGAGREALEAFLAERA